MPVRVDVPTRVRVDPGALTERRADLEDALGKAAGRALANSADVVLRPRASYASARLNYPEFTWHGTGLGEVPTSVRTEVEECVAEVLWRAAERAGLAGRAEERPRAVERVVEAVDDSRYDRLLALYEIPSYDGTKRRAPVGGDAHRVKRVETETKIVWYRLHSDEAEQQYFNYFDTQGYSVHAPGYVGAIYLGYDGRFHITVYRYPGQQHLASFEIVSLTQLKRDEKTHELVEVDVGAFDAEARFRLAWFAEGGAAAESALRDFYTPAVTAILKEGAPADWATVDIAPRVDAIVRRKVEQPGVTSWVRLTVDGVDSILSLEGDPFPREVYSAQLIPLTTVAELPVSRVGKGAGDGEAAKAAAGKGGTAAEGGAAAAGQPSPAGLESPEPGEAGFLPPSKAVDTDELTCESYRGEPSYKELGQMGLELKAQMERISHLLAIPPCEYIGNFLHNAAQALGGRAASIEEFDPAGFEPAEVRSTPNGDGNLGSVEFIPKPSAQIVMMRRLAAVVPLIHQLKGWMEAAYEANPNSISGTWSGEPLGWEIRHGYFMNKTMEVSVANIFARTCQVLFLQLLKTSKAEIEKRQKPGYSDAFEHIILPQLMPLSELIRVREILDNGWQIEYARYGFASPVTTQYNPKADRFKDVRFLDAPPPASPPGLPASWEEAWRNLTGTLAPKLVAPPPPSADVYELFKQDGSYRVRDLHGHIWSKENLEMRITLLRGALETADPLIKQFHDIPEVMARFTAAQTMERFYHTTGLVKAELDKVLAEMHRENESRTEEAQSEWLTAFKTTEIVEGYGGVHIPGTGYTLQGIHKMAHEQIGEAFNGDTYYALGVDYLFTVEDKKLLKKIISIDLMLLSILVPPLGEFLNLAWSAYELGEAQKKEAAWKALIDPDEVMNWAAIEAELFAAKLGMVFAAIPYVGRAGAEIKAVATKAFARGAAEVAEEVAVAAAREASGLARFGAAALELLELTQRSVISAVVAGMAEQLLIGEVLNWMIDPMIKAVQQEAEKQAPVGGIEHALDLIAQRLADRRAAAEVEAGATL